MESLQTQMLQARRRAKIAAEIAILVVDESQDARQEAQRLREEARRLRQERETPALPLLGESSRRNRSAQL